jgi:hypothetical protein
MNSRLIGVTLSLGIILLFASSIGGQKPAESASIVVHVTDPTGADIPYATVQSLPLPKTPGGNPTTDRSGKLSIDLSPGSYDLTFRSQGFRTETRHIEVKNGAHQTINVVLELGRGGGVGVQPAYLHLDTSPAPLSDQLSTVCNEQGDPAQLSPNNPIYGDAKRLAHTLDDVGLPVRCILSSKVQHIFKGQKGAALYRIDDGSFEVIFLRKAETFNGIQISEHVSDPGTANTLYNYSFLGTPRSLTTLSVSKRSYFIKQGNMLFYIWGDEALAVNLRTRLSQPDLLEHGSSVR